MRDYAVLLSAIRPQTPFASSLPASIQTPRPEPAQLENRRRRPSSPYPALRMSEIKSMPLESTATPPRRRQPQPCRRCAASAQRRNWRSSLFLSENFSHQRLKSRLFLQWVQHRIDFEKDNIEPGAFLVAAFKPFDSLTLFPQRHVQQGIAIRWNIAVRCDLRQLRQNL